MYNFCAKIFACLYRSIISDSVVQNVDSILDFSQADVDF